MTDKEIIIDGVNVAGCDYAILPKDSCLAKPQPYAKETSCIACKEHNTKLNFCKNNPNCYYKQLQRKEQECEELKEASLTLAEGLNYRQNKLDNYKQALKKIEEYCKNHKYTGWVDVEGIMDIINEVKKC